MKTNSCLTALFVFIHCLAFADGDNMYDVAKISPSLLKGANAVKRLEKVVYIVNDPGNAVYYYKIAVTILDESGDINASWAEFYGRYSAITSVSANLYDAGGKKIKSLKNREIADVSGNSESNLADDYRYKHHDFHHKTYPYTVEYEVEIKQHQLMFMPGWMPVVSPKYSVESSVFEVVVPANYKLRYKSFQYSKEPVSVTENGTINYHWEVGNIAALTDEFAAPEWQKISPSVIIGATDFEIEKHKGNMSSWSDFGKFVYNLKENRDKLPDNIKVMVHQLTDNETNAKKKIEILYKYLQQNTRYISIQLGIGGWQPFDAEYVATRKYGDCKALTNFMFSLLKEAGIRSVYTLVKSGDSNKYFNADFVSSPFTHVILSVPLAKDTVWLECTDQYLPAGYLSAFTEGRYALMVTEEGGKLVRTPAYKMKDNSQSRHIKATLDESGKLVADVTTDYKAIQQDDLFGFINHHTKKEQLEYLKKEIDLPNYDIVSFDYKSLSSSLPILTESLHLVAENYAQVSGRRIFIQPNILNKSKMLLPDEDRKYDIYLTVEFADIDTIEMAIPNGFEAESLPQPLSVCNKFANYKIDYKLSGNKVLMTRLLEKKSGSFPKTDYKELVKLYSDIYKADRAKIVLIKKEG